MDDLAPSFESAIRLSPAGPGCFEATLVPWMTIDGTRPNGGYLLALMGRAAAEATAAAGHPHPLAATSQYLSAPTLGPARVEVEVLRPGRTASQVQVRLLQEGRICVQALFVLGRLSDGAEVFWNRQQPFPVVEFDRAVDFRAGMERPPSMHLTFEARFDPRSLGGEGSAPELPAELRAWMRFHDDRPADPLSLLLAADALPPAAWGLGLSGWVPTLQLSVYVRALPAPGPLRIRQMARLVQDGFLDEICEVWDSADHLVAQATQLAAYRLPEP